MNVGDLVAIIKAPHKFGERNEDIHVGDIAEVCVDIGTCERMGWVNTVGLKFDHKIHAGHDCSYCIETDEDGWDGYRISGCDTGYGWFLSTDCLQLVGRSGEDNFEFDVDDIKTLMQ